MKIRQDRKYKFMYWVVWDDGIKSADFYSKTWAKEHIRRINNGEE